MRKILIGIVLVLCMVVPAAASEIAAPEAPESALDRMPQNTESFGKALAELLQNSIHWFQPELERALQTCADILLSAILISLFRILAGKQTGVISLGGTVIIAGILLRETNALISCAADSVWEICEYEKLLCPVLTTALAAQGGITASAALYAGTTVFIAFLSTLTSRMLVPMVYLFLLLSVAYCATGEEILRNAADASKSFLSWLLKSVLMVFTTYMSITGVVSGTTDTAALKAAKVSISSVVPVVGSILSDASESVLVSIGILKNTAGVYGILAVIAVFLEPFLKVGVQYLILKASAAVSGIFAEKRIHTLLNDFSSAMGLLVAMVATGCISVLISTVCFMKGIG